MTNDIEARLQQLERDNAELRDRIDKMEGERGRIRSGLSKILNTIMGKQTKHDQQIAEQDGRIGALETWRQEIATPRGKGDTAELNQRRLLLHLLDWHFSEQEIKSLAYEVGVDYEDLPRNGGKEGLIREFVIHMERRGRMGRLIDRCRELRPEVPAWPFMVDETEWV